MAQHEWVGYDPKGIGRVWGKANSNEVAESRCLMEAYEYVQKRPDTGPLAKWSFHEIGSGVRII